MLSFVLAAEAAASRRGRAKIQQNFMRDHQFFLYTVTLFNLF